MSTASTGVGGRRKPADQRIDEDLASLVVLFEKSASRIGDRGERFLRLYKDKAPSIKGPESAYLRGMTDAMILPLASSIAMYSFELDGAAIIDMYSTLEHFLRVECMKLLKDSPKTVRRLIDKSYLTFYADILSDMGVFDQSDVSFISRLTTVRNGLTHRKLKQLSDVLGKEFTMMDIYSGAERVDAAPFIIDAMVLLHKTLMFELKKQDKYPRFQASD